MTSASRPAIIAVDIDGTLLDPQGRVLPGTRAEFARARTQGTTILLASGRPIPGLRRLVETVHLGRDGLVLAGSNGSVVVDGATGAPIARHSIDDATTRRLLTFASRFDGVVLMACDGDELVVDRPEDPQVSIECDGNAMTLRAVPDLTALPDGAVRVDKLLLYGRPEVLRPAAAAVREEFGDTVETAFSAPFYFEVTAAGVDKGSALADAAAHIGVDAGDSVAFGDNGNDLPMLRRAGIGVAMGNAIAEVRDAADRVTAGNAEEGIALVLAELYGDGTPAPAVDVPETENMYPDGFDVVLNDEPGSPAGDPDSTRGTTV